MEHALVTLSLRSEFSMDAFNSAIAIAIEEIGTWNSVFFLATAVCIAFVCLSEQHLAGIRALGRQEVQQRNHRELRVSQYSKCRSVLQATQSNCRRDALFTVVHLKCYHLSCEIRFCIQNEEWHDVIHDLASTSL